MKKVKLFEEYISEATTSWGKMMKGVRAGSGGPWSIVAIQDKKVVGQSNDIKIQDLIPAKYEALKAEFPKAKLHIEDVGGGVVWNESLNEALAASSQDKLTNHDTLTAKVNATLISNARNGVLKMMKEPGGKTHYWNPETKEYVAKTITYNGKGEYLYSDAIDADGNLTESYVAEATSIQKDLASKIHNTIEGDEDNKKTILNAMHRTQNQFDPLTINIATGYEGSAGMDNRLDRLKTLSPTKLNLILKELNTILGVKESLNEAKELTRDELMNLLETKYGIKTVRNSEDFNGQTEGIWIAADNDEEISGTKIFDYYNRSAKYANGVLKQFRTSVEKTGWWFEWNDPGTIMIWPKN